MKQEISAGVIVYSKDATGIILYLLLKNANGHWDLPKGKIESNETLIETAQRELMEEAGITAEIVSGFEESIYYLFFDASHKPVNKTVTFFLGKASSQTVTISSEHTAYIWLSFPAAYQKVTHENTRKLLDKAQEVIKNKE